MAQFIFARIPTKANTWVWISMNKECKIFVNGFVPPPIDMHASLKKFESPTTEHETCLAFTFGVNLQHASDCATT